MRNWREIRRLQKMFGTETIVHESALSATTEIPFSNAASCIRRELWELHNFALPAAEDIEWASWAVASGYKIIYEARTSVYHSHDDTCRQMAWRAIQFEKAADIRTARRRRFLLTLRQGIVLTLRDAKEIMRLKETNASRTKLLTEALLRSFWFVRDFQRE